MRVEDLPRGVRVVLREDPSIEGVIVPPPGAPAHMRAMFDPNDAPNLDDWTDEEGCVWVLWALPAHRACADPLPYNTEEVEIPNPISALGDLVRDLLDDAQP